MNRERLMNVLLSPHVSEKGTTLADQYKQFVFKVAKDAQKPEIARAVEWLFDVEVASVRVVNVKGKVKRFGRTLGRRKHWKKAYVGLKAGYDIDFTTG